jgi:acyl carrier protein
VKETGRFGRKGQNVIMSREEVFEKLNEVFRDVFDDDEITVTDTTTADDIEDWDSLEHINLLAAVEQEFGMKFNMGQVVSMKNVGEMADIILSQIS